MWLATVGFQLDTDEGGSFLPGFVEALIGIQNGETRNFDLTFPQTWEQESLRGFQARFTVSTKSLPSSFHIEETRLDDSTTDEAHFQHRARIKCYLVWCVNWWISVLGDIHVLDLLGATSCFVG